MDITYISLGGMHIIKRQLKKEFPQAKHTHRLEAFSRACGFNSYNGLIAALEQHDRIDVTPRADLMAFHLQHMGERLGR